MPKTKGKNSRSPGSDVPINKRENPRDKQRQIISDCKDWHSEQCGSPDVVEYELHKEQENYYGNTAQGYEDVGSLGERDPTVNIRPNDREGTKIFLCKSCKKEFTYRRSGNTDGEFKIIDPVQYPRYLILHVTDTGTMLGRCSISSNSLKSGDHVAWISWAGFMYHHAIVTEVNDGSFTCMEWSRSENKINLLTRANVGVSARSPMFKVQYPANITHSNPQHVVVARARSRSDDRGYKLLFDNCEHFASFCKTGNHISSQIVQYRLCAVRLHLILLSILRVLMIVIISEIIEYLDAKLTPSTTPATKHEKTDAEFASVDSLIVIEMVYMIMSLAVLHLWDIPQTKFLGDTRGSSVSWAKLFYVHVRIIMRSVCILVSAVTLNLEAYYIGKNMHYSPIATAILETAFATFGGLGGLAICIVVFDYLWFVLGSCVCSGRENTNKKSYQRIP